MTKKDLAEQERREKIKELRKMIKPGDAVYCKLEHVSRSGMQRRITFMVIKNNKPLFIDHLVEGITNFKRAAYPKEGLIVGGCGIDMGFAVVYALGRCMYPKGFKLPKDQKYGRNGDTSGFETDGGYAYKHAWL